MFRREYTREALIAIGQGAGYIVPTTTITHEENPFLGMNTMCLGQPSGTTADLYTFACR